MTRIARLITPSLAPLALALAGCGGSAPGPGTPTAVEGAEGVYVQEEWPDEVKEAEAKFQQDAAAGAR